MYFPTFFNNYLFCLLIVFTSYYSFGQSKKDSLLAAAENINAHDSLRTKAFYELSYLYRDIELDTALLYTKAMSEMAEENNLPQYKVRYFHMSAYYYSFSGEQDSAIHYLKKADEELKLHYTIKDEVAINTNYSVVYYHLGDYAKVLEYNEKAIELSKQNRSKDLHRAYYNRAIAFINLGMTEQAKNYFFLSYHQSKKEDDLNGSVGAMRGVAYILGVVEGKMDSMLYYLDEVKALCRVTNDNNNWCDYYMMERTTFNSIGDQEKALESMKQYLFHATQLNDSYKVMGAQTEMAKSANLAGNIELANTHYLQFEAMIPNNPYYDLIASNYKSWAQFESNNNNYKKAYELVEKHFSYQDSLNQKQNREALTKADAKYKSALKDATLAKQEIQIVKQSSQRNMSLSTALLFLCVAIFLWYRKQYSEKVFMNRMELDQQKINQLEREKKILSLSSMIEGQESERKRISQDLHDGLGGLLATIKVKFGVIQKEIAELESMNIYQQTSTMIDDACSEVRKIAHNMMPDSLTKLGLIEAIRDIAEHTTLLNIKVINLGTHSLSETQEIMLYRVIQEFINNTRKHANASEVIVQFSTDDNHSMLYLEDDGKGFDTHDSSQKTGLGLKSMASRVNFLGGSCELESVVGIGTTVQIKIPVD